MNNRDGKIKEQRNRGENRSNGRGRKCDRIKNMEDGKQKTKTKKTRKGNMKNKDGNRKEEKNRRKI